METTPIQDPALLRERVDYLEEANREHLFAMDLAASMVHFHGKLSHTRETKVILNEAQKFLRRLLLDFKVMAFFTVDEEDASFPLELCSPAAQSAAIEALSDELIETGEFAWALNQHRVLVARGKVDGHSVILHQLATDQRIRGMFIGVLDLGGKELSGSFHNLFSIVFRNTAYALESAELYRMLDDHNKNLELRVAQRTAELNSANRELERANQFIRNTFGRYMSDEVVESILDTPEGLRLGGERREVTAMFTDLRGFTAISERLDSEEVVTILNLYLEVMTEIILKYNGTIIEFLGDGVLVLFGAPVTREDDARRAVACGLEMQGAMTEVNARNRELGYPDLNMGIGINTGTVVAGNIGSEKRSKYSVVGTTINVAARIESFTLGGQVMIADSTRLACEPLLRIDDVLEVRPKGIPHAISIHQVGAIGGPYGVALPEPVKLDYVYIPEGLTVRFTVLVDKNAGEMDHAGEITALAESAAEIRTDTRLERLTNLKLALYRDGAEFSAELFGKVIGNGGGDDDPTLLVTFTQMPDDVATLLQTLRTTAAGTGAP